MRRLSLTCVSFLALVLVGVPASRTIWDDSARAAAAQRQAPGWSRGQQNLAISYDECLRRMAAALQTEGYRRDDQSGGDFAVGIKDVHTAVIICSPAPEGNMLVHVVVASNGDGGGAERQRLQAQMERTGSATGNCDASAGTRWDETEEGWTQTLTRRGNSNVFDVRATKPGVTALTAVETIDIRGNRVFRHRTQASDGNTCELEGTIAVDGVTVTGTYRCKGGGPYSWQAKIRCD